MMRFCPLFLVLCVGLAAGEPDRSAGADYGPALVCDLIRSLPPDPDSKRDKPRRDRLCLRGLAVRLAHGEAGACYDHASLAVTAVWDGGFLDLSGTMSARQEGTRDAAIAGPARWRLRGPGWRAPDGEGLPEGSRWLGHRLHGVGVVARYRVGAVAVLDHPAIVDGAFVRHLRIDSGPALVLRTGPADGPAWRGVDLPPGAEFARGEEAWELALPARDEAAVLAVVAGDGGPDAARDPAALEPARRWKPLTTALSHGGTAAGYRLDTLAMPHANPWKSWLRGAGLADLGGDRLALSTIAGDVWIVAGIAPEDGAELTWTRFATGLYEPMGLEVIDGELVALCRDGLYRLRDTDGDGEADAYDCLHNAWPMSAFYHAFSLCLIRDRAGNLYHAKGGHAARKTPMHGGIVRTDANLARSELVVTGLRQTNGMAFTSGGALVVNDNQGEWMPATALFHVRPGDHCGYPLAKEPAEKPDDWRRPWAWLPQAADNSAAGLAVVPDERWGPFAGRLVQVSFGASAMLVTFAQPIGDDRHQGGAFRLPHRFASGLLRVAFRATDGQAYVCGSGGWGTNAREDGCLQRLVWIGDEATCLPDGAYIDRRGIHLRFTAPVDPETATDPASYRIRTWNYKRSAQYGSGHHDRGELPVTAATVAEDGRTVLLAVDGLAPVDQVETRIRIRSAAGEPVEHTLHHTVHAVPDAVDWEGCNRFAGDWSEGDGP